MIFQGPVRSATGGGYLFADNFLKFANKVREMFTNVQYRKRQSSGWGRRQVGILPAAVTPIPYHTCYCTSVQFANCICGLLVNMVLWLLTLIQPGEVKIDLANFDVKFRTKFLYVRLFFIWPIPAETSCESFWTSDTTSKNDVLTSILTFFIRSRAKKTNCRPLPFRLVLLWIQTTWWREKSRRAVVRSEVRRQSTFQSISAAGRVECEGWRVLSRACSLSLSYCIAAAAPFWADFRNHSALWHTTQIPGEVSLHLLKARSKQNRPRYLTTFPDPGWFKVNPPPA